MVELFRTFDETGHPLDLVPRPLVHQRGLWHKAVQVLLFDPTKQMLLQQRASSKDLYPNAWDNAVGEHLLPDESFYAGAHRGIKEELGIMACELKPFTGEIRFEVHNDECWDREIQQVFYGVHDGALKPDPEEVQRVLYIDRNTLDDWLMSSPQEFTPWFVNHWPQLCRQALDLALFE